MERPKMLSTIVRFLKDKGQDLLSKYYARENIVMGVFRFLSTHEQQIIISCLSHNPSKIHLEKSKLDKSVKVLQSLGLVQLSENSMALHPVFKSTTISVLSRGHSQLFISKQQSNTLKAEGGEELMAEEHFKKWIEVYNYILRNVITKNSSVRPRKKLKKVFGAILKSKGLKIKPEEFQGYEEENDRLKEDKKKLSGFGFLIRPLWVQINLVLMYYCEFLMDKAQQSAFQSSISDQGYCADLLDFVFGLNFLDPDHFYIVNQQSTHLSSREVQELLDDLEHIGLVEFDDSGKGERAFRPTKLLIHFLTPNIGSFQSFKTNIIVENDFKIYAYSTLDYVRHFMSKLIRLIHRPQSDFSQYVDLFN